MRLLARQGLRRGPLMFCILAGCCDCLRRRGLGPLRACPACPPPPWLGRPRVGGKGTNRSRAGVHACRIASSRRALGCASSRCRGPRRAVVRTVGCEAGRAVAAGVHARAGVHSKGDADNSRRRVLQSGAGVHHKRRKRARAQFRHECIEVVKQEIVRQPCSLARAQKSRQQGSVMRAE